MYSNEIGSRVCVLELFSIYLCYAAIGLDVYLLSVGNWVMNMNR